MRCIMIWAIILSLPALCAASKYAGEFQELGVNARACAMGNVGVALCDDAATVYFNPAGSIFAVRSLTVMHAENFGGMVKNEFGAAIVPKENYAAGIGIQYLSVGGIKSTTLPDTALPPGNDNQPVPLDTLSTGDLVIYLNGARAHSIIAYGANVKLYYRNLAVITGYGGGLDLGARIDLPYFKVGISLRDFVLSPLVWNNGTTETISTKIAVGAAPCLTLARLSSTVALEIDGCKFFDRSGIETNFGLEYGYKNTFFGRIGAAGGNYTFGIGLRIRKLNFDYALATHSRLKNSNKFSAGLEF